jgi:CubicO group peptidase (beta-lactamase class C family)
MCHSRTRATYVAAVAVAGHLFVAAKAADAQAPFRGCGSPQPDGIATPGIGVRLHDFVTRIANLGAFTGSVLVARNGAVVLQRGYGLVNPARCGPVTTSTMFAVGSIAKQFLAVAILRLEMERRLQTTDSLSRFFRQVPPDKRSITLHQLLNHTSGLPGDLERPGERVTLAHDSSALPKLLALPLASAPGDRFRYSNAGYALLRLVVESASGLTFERYVATTLLDPNGLHRTGWVGQLAAWPSSAVAHAGSGLYASGSPRDWPSYAATLGAGDMVSTPGELFKWTEALTSGRILAEAQLQKLFTPSASWGGPGVEGRGDNAQYAYGWETRADSAGRIVLRFHNGTTDNFRATMRLYAREALVVIVLSSQRQQDAGDQADELANGLVDLVRNGSDVTFAPASSHTYSAAFSGRFRMSSGGAFRVWPATADRLWIAPEGQDAFDLLWGADSARRALNASITGRTQVVLDSLRAIPCSRSQPGWSAMWCGLGVGRPALRGTKILGVAPLTWSEDWSMSYVRVAFGDSALTVSFEWRGHELLRTTSSDEVPFPQAYPLAGRTASELLMYDRFTGRTVTVELLPQADRERDILIVRGPLRAGNARRERIP